jgi:hypothetical protein
VYRPVMFLHHQGVEKAVPHIRCRACNRYSSIDRSAVRFVEEGRLQDPSQFLIVDWEPRPELILGAVA